MDNGTAEYSFVTRFFAPEPELPSQLSEATPSSHLFSPDIQSLSLPEDGLLSPATDLNAATPRPLQSAFSDTQLSISTPLSKEDQTSLNSLWKQIMDPSLDHALVRNKSVALMAHVLLSVVELR